MKNGIFFVVISAFLVLMALTALISSIAIWKGFLNLLVWTVAFWGSLVILGESLRELREGI